MPYSDTIECDLTVIGRGMAGMAAALFAAEKGISTVQVGTNGGIIFASGLFDLFSVHPVNEKNIWKDPWMGIEALIRDIPGHPYSRLTKEEIQLAFEEMLGFLNVEGLHYCRAEEGNSEVITPLGTTKHTYCVPQGMWNGVLALKEKKPCLLVDFPGMNGFSALQLAENLKEAWRDLRSARIPFPEGKGQGTMVVGDVMARGLELPEKREKLAGMILPYVKEAQHVGLPAVLGMSHHNEVIQELGARLGVPVFEIPTFSLSIPGLRLMETFTNALSKRGVRQFEQERVLVAERRPDGRFALGIGNKKLQTRVVSKGIILASGRFWGKGLYAFRNRIKETVFDLPVSQPAERSEWHRKDFFDLRGHPVNQAGLETDDSYRPLGDSGKPAFDNLFAAGSILAHQDWMRMKCGSGLAIATAYGAVNGFSN
ncbi:MAG: glycerol-3-phosphate dehydrogenase subunit GlpB [Desulfatiglandaceae bacterium]